MLQLLVLQFIVVLSIAVIVLLLVCKMRNKLFDLRTLWIGKFFYVDLGIPNF
jgi:hypothetical protein